MRSIRLSDPKDKNAIEDQRIAFFLISYPKSKVVLINNSFYLQYGTATIQNLFFLNCYFSCHHLSFLMEFLLCQHLNKVQ